MSWEMYDALRVFAPIIIGVAVVGFVFGYIYGTWEWREDLRKRWRK